MTEPHPLAARAAEVRDELVSPGTAHRELIEYAVLTVAGLDGLRDRLVTESNAVAARARGRVTALLRERFGGRRPQLSGWHSLLVFLLTFAPVAPIALLASLRLGTDGTEPAAAVATAVIGLLQLAVALSVAGKPVVRSTLFQAQVSAVLVVGVAVVGAVITAAPLPALFLTGAAGSVAAVLVYLRGRRDRERTQLIDDGLETAYLDVSAEVAAERARLLDGAARELREAGVDVDGVKALRTSALALLRSTGNPAVDDDPDAIPGAYLILGHTSAWLPPTHRDRGEA
ncbi:hypothetical protein [Microbacterium sp. T2.11-28]|uniref:hypothetical protein n=1 Tax=Microbacterium sp. T2.11-28 TaxID=3041169 RepID=UPI002477BC24|nr:hypothetical protein [Microbacterium sp. T2.11-28]CAI9392914.1 hypothetical protein MICABA_02270 [Microbacterium sp. T2.11-28]